MTLGELLIESYSDGQKCKIGKLLKGHTRVEYREVRNMEPVL